MEEKSIIKLICQSRTLCPCYDSDGIVKIYNNYMKLQKTVLILLILQAVVSADECVADQIGELLDPTLELSYKQPSQLILPDDAILVHKVVSSTLPAQFQGQHYFGRGSHHYSILGHGVFIFVIENIENPLFQTIYKAHNKNTRKTESVFYAPLFNYAKTTVSYGKRKYALHQITIGKMKRDITQDYLETQSVFQFGHVEIKQKVVNVIFATAADYKVSLQTIKEIHKIVQKITIQDKCGTEPVGKAERKELKQEETKKIQPTVKKEDAKQEVKKDEVKENEVKKDEVKKDEVKKPDVKKEDAKQEVKKDEAKKEEVKKEQVKKEQVKKEEVKKEEVKKEEVKKEEVKKEEVKKEEVKKEEVKKEEVKKEEVKREEVKKEEVKKEEVKKDEQKHVEPKKQVLKKEEDDEVDDNEKPEIKKRVISGQKEQAKMKDVVPIVNLEDSSSSDDDGDDDLICGLVSENSLKNAAEGLTDYYIYCTKSICTYGEDSIPLINKIAYFESGKTRRFLDRPYNGVLIAAAEGLGQNFASITAQMAKDCKIKDFDFHKGIYSGALLSMRLGDGLKFYSVMIIEPGLQGVKRSYKNRTPELYDLLENIEGVGAIYQFLLVSDDSAEEVFDDIVSVIDAAKIAEALQLDCRLKTYPQATHATFITKHLKVQKKKTQKAFDYS